MDLSKEFYINVLRREHETLLKEFYRPDEEGTGHYNTAASVLEWRIKSLESEILEEENA
jgi:hypothetical protein